MHMWHYITFWATGRTFCSSSLAAAANRQGSSNAAFIPYGRIVCTLLLLTKSCILFCRSRRLYALSRMP